MATGVLLAFPQTANSEIRVTREEFRDVERLHIREFFSTPEHPEMMPTKKGVSFKLPKDIDETVIETLVDSLESLKEEVIRGKSTGAASQAASKEKTLGPVSKKSKKS